MNSFPKIYQLGKREIENIFKSEVEITEKVDGSQFCFGVDLEGKLRFRSKGKELFFDGCEKMFQCGAQYIIDFNQTICNVLKPGTFIYGELLSKPKHNVLAYERVPNHNIIVFGVLEGLNYVEDYGKIKEYADKLDLETVPLIFKGLVETPEHIQELVGKTVSVLGKEIIEGIVVKNYRQHTSIGDPSPCFGKYVRAEFKERHGDEWQMNSKKNTLEQFIEGFRHEGRMRKAMQHLRERGLLTESLKDIGPLIVEVKNDIRAEESNTIKEFLFKQFIEQIERKAVAGLPEWYKDVLLKGAFNEGPEQTNTNPTPVENNLG